MHFVPVEINKPIHPADFEDMCCNIYGHVFDDRTPKMNGRPGQQQHGVDIFVRDKSGRIGIQCKRYMDGTLTLKKVITEVKAAEKAGSPIVKLIVATTSENDAKLLRDVQDLSDTRESEGKFPVEIEFWGDICRHIRKSGRLSQDYAPHEPGGVYYEIRQQLLQLNHIHLEQSQSQANTRLSLPEALPNSINQFVTNQLDSINDLITQGLYNDARTKLNQLGTDLKPFDEHQKSRWYLQRGNCSWHQRDLVNAANDMHTAADLYPDHEKMAAARSRAYLLQNEGKQALASALDSLKRFPVSPSVWVVYLNSKLVQGQNVELSEIPDELRGNEDILQILAWIKLNKGESEQALNLIGMATGRNDASFYTKRAALTIALQLATSDPVRVGYDLIPRRYLAAVNDAVDSLEPLSDNLWTNQSNYLISETVDHLGLAYLILNQPEKAIELVKSADSKGILSPALKRVAITAYVDQNDYESFSHYAEAWIEDLDETALVQVAETAGNEGQLQLIKKVSERLSAMQNVASEHLDIVTSLSWIAAWKQPDTSESILNELKSIYPNELHNTYRLCGAAAVFHFAGELQLRDQALSRAVDLTKPDEADQQCLLLADMLFAAGDFATASKYYQRFTEAGYISRLHTHLLACYIRSGNWKLAKKMLAQFPHDWTDNEDLRALAYELSEKAGDLDFLEQISEAEWKAKPLSLGAWLMRLSVAQRMQKMFLFHDLLRQVPIELVGSPRQVAQIAQLELKYDRCDQGMRRIYQLYRSSLDSIDAATAYFMAIINSHKELPYMEEILPSVQPGSTITLESEDGDEIVVSIDPDGLGTLPKSESFYASSSIDVAALIGLSQNETVSMPGPLGFERRFKVTQITSVFRYLLQLAQKRFKSSLSKTPPITSIKVIKDSGEADFTQFTKIAKARHDQSQHVLETYATSPLTLGSVGRVLGLNPIDLVLGWPTDGAPLVASSGNQNEIDQARQLVTSLDRCYVIDSLTIAELVNLDCAQALSIFNHLVCSTHTLMLLEHAHEEALEDSSTGTLAYRSGSIDLIEHDAKQKLSRVELLARMIEVVHNHCRVVPGYGSTNLPDNLRMYQEVLSYEEFSTLLLVDEYDGHLLTLDGRLAHICHEIFNKVSLWPQVLLEKAVKEHCITIRTYSYALLRQLCWNRSFVSITKFEMELMLYQSYPAVQFGVRKLKQYFADSRVDPILSQNVIFEFLELIAEGNIKIGAFCEIFEHMLDALRSHPRIEQKVLFVSAKALILKMTDPEVPNYWVRDDIPFDMRLHIRKCLETREYLLQRLHAYIERSMRSKELPRISRPLRIRSLMHTVPPTLLYDDLNCVDDHGNDSAIMTGE